MENKKHKVNTNIIPNKNNIFKNKELKRDNAQIPKGNSLLKRKTDTQNNNKKVRVADNKKPRINNIEKKTCNKDPNFLNLHGKIVSEEINNVTITGRNMNLKDDPRWIEARKKWIVSENLKSLKK
jgi:hypothetical protein